MKNASLKVLFFLCLSLTIFLLTVSYLFYNFYLQSRAAPSSIIDTQTVTEDSYVQENTSTANFSLHKDEGYLYKSKNEGGAAVLEFLNNNPQYQPEENLLPKNTQIKGTSTIQNNPQKLIPKNFIQNSFLSRFLKDRQDKFLTARNFNLNGEHFFYNQKIGNIPVFAGILAVHLRNGNEIYSVDGNLIFNETLKAEKISEEQAKEIALGKARQEETAGIPLKIAKSERFILNLKILGLSDDETNYSTLAVTINSDTQPLFFSKEYFVDLDTGKIIFDQDLIREALNRTIYNCNNTNSCPPTRSEGSAPSGNSDVDNAYSLLGNTYNYYKNNFGRDSYDDNGGPVDAYVHIPSSNAFPCPNAAWLGKDVGNGGNIIFCDGMVTNDVLAHEYTHIVTGSTPDLMYQAQSGALNESISDIFGYALDSDDWTMGEETTLGVIRYMDDPTKSPKPTGGQPDHLFSVKYYCGGLPNSCSSANNDSCGVHYNNGVMNKAFYLMTDGGSFNGCTISGIGKEKSHPIVYRALTTYLKQQSNFKAMYMALLQACSDLYQATSNECAQVKSALQATEMDQQLETTQVGPICPGSGVTRQTPECAGGQVTPTPTAATPTASPPLSFTPGGPTNTPWPTITPGGPTSTPPPLAAVRLNLKLKFQGILQKPSPQYDKMAVRIGVFNPFISQTISKTAEFVADENGDWWGSTTFPEISPASNYTIFIKGPKHIQKKICQSQPTETLPGTYRCAEGNIALTLGDNNFVFTHIYQLVGDLPEQDGIVNSYDISLIRNNLNKADADSLKLADLNLDGVVNNQDYSLIIAALSIRVDEE